MGMSDRQEHVQPLLRLINCSGLARWARAAPEVVAGAARRKARIPGMHDARVRPARGHEHSDLRSVLDHQPPVSQLTSANKR